jgi:endonuclease G
MHTVTRIVITAIGALLLAIPANAAFLEHLLIHEAVHVASHSARHTSEVTSETAHVPLPMGNGFSACPQFFYQGVMPNVPNAGSMKPRELCFDAFAVYHSGVSHTPLFVAEKLNRQQIVNAHDEERTNLFFADARLPSAERAELIDYKGSGYDRGHMAPAGDQPNDQAMAQSFSLANMVPQAPKNNRGVWAMAVENAVRKYVLRARGDVYVITGPVFTQKHDAIPHGAPRVWVPDYLYKLVYDPSAGKTWAYWVPNTNEARVDGVISYQELVKRTGIQFLSQH